MTVIDSFTERCLKVAARRWPADMRDERYREWTAEMHEIRSDASTSGGRRAWEQLRYAFSLAASPPAPDENRVPRGWREMAPQLGQRLRPWAVLFGMGVVCSLLAGTARGMVPGVLGAVTGTHTDPSGERPAIITVASALALLGIIVLTAWLGVVIGRRMPLLPDPRGRAARVVSVVGAPVAVGLGLIVIDAGQMLELTGSGAISAQTWLYGPLLWMAMFAVVALVAVALARSGRSGVGRALGIAMSLFALEVLAVPLAYLGAASIGFRLPASPAVALWFPMSLVGGPLADEHLTHTGVSQVMPMLVVASGFTLWYAIAASRVRVTAPRPAPKFAGSASLIVSRPRTGFALATAAIGLAVWAAGLAYATPAGIAMADLGDSQFMMWASELRITSIVLICVAMGLAMVGRGRPILTLFVTASGLLVSDTVLDAFDRTGITGLAGAVGFGVVVLVAAWWLGRTMLLAPPSAAMVRRGHIGIAVTAAMCAPFILTQSTWPETASEGAPEVPTPVVFPAVATVVLVLLTAVAGVSAVAARQRPVSTPVSVALIGLPVLVFGGLGVASGQAGLPGFGSIVMLGALLGLPYTVWVLATIWWDRVRNPGRAGMAWTGIAVAAVPGTVVVIVVGVMGSTMVTGPLMTLQGAGYPADGVSVMPGVILAAIGLGTLTSRIMGRDPRPDSDSRAATANTPQDLPHGHNPYPVAS
ncbi:hypothetical protein [Stackebrandtia nassauensis]|uniref:Uncharacterized protein n=1 Tax=Stackebrandtia nassauensis (strain DSM 44728 / CIP 108903 / NRRL B-16338 / NBRC 102104 / LLR-40K-21) TaxID=446470 RepID=D3PXA4_STANL|nr:hypothetical protein [Stackebrandtia nassauensis]ADD41367.1 hypothetical protein Snas_1665 [Stackebrandtia nassauensis DSM 44728]